MLEVERPVVLAARRGAVVVGVTLTTGVAAMMT
jgi:hypothetical protein